MKEMPKKALLRGSVVLMVSVFLCLFPWRVMADNTAMHLYSQWDENLPDLIIRDVDTTAPSFSSRQNESIIEVLQRSQQHEDVELTERLSNESPAPQSLAEVWQTFTIDYGIRSVLIINLDMYIHSHGMSFQCSECQARDLFNAFSDAYGLAWETDPDTSVIWFFPKHERYENILPTEIDISEDIYGMPMYAGVLMALNDESKALHINHFATSIVGVPTGDDYNYNIPVDIPKGKHSLRDIISYMCISSPRITFFGWSEGKNTNLQPVNLKSPYSHGRNLDQIAGLKMLRDTELSVINEYLDSFPEMYLLIQMMASESAKNRWAARAYLEFKSDLYGDKWINNSILEEDEKVWLALSLLKHHAPVEGSSYELMITPLLREYVTSEFLKNCRIDLAILAALEMARVLDDVESMKIVTQREIPQEILDDLISDAARIARLSDTAWLALSNTEWGLASVAPGWVECITHGKKERQTKMVFKIVFEGEGPDGTAAGGTDITGSVPYGFWILLAVSLFFLMVFVLIAVNVYRKSYKSASR
jgi:hypothetical protein